MKIRNSIFLTSGLMAVGIAVFFMACEVLDAPYKKDNIVIQSERKVLLEDYTSHECVNCPTAGKVSHELLDIYGDNVVVIAVHAGQLSKILIPPCTYNFTTATGDLWCSYFEVENQGFPNGLVNRKERSGSKIIPYNNWFTVVAEELAQPAEAELLLEADFTPSTREIEVQFSSNIKSPVPGEKYYVTIVLTEDSIIKPQKNNNATVGTTPVIMDYKHMHVLRTNITDHWGLEVNPSIIDTRTVKRTLPEGYDYLPEKCHIVAFISNANREVLQAEEIKLLP
ncbi:MAG TPA: Omp28-related outer membrane protein [Bacteroidales bacterium]|nr:Omp28-related outer membrane protein [Bacteroidales bacterium]HRZ48858.1 Omp28-related outer membrane protein [Bacteroidales bacterium]